ncbi:MAG: regulatory protein MerR [Crocinitomicaceae bacterium]|jgi:DNA-binding transcriptional MerR regulator|nr:regulatory protein MerR [Crocinitomicaceae bacterium]
MGVYKIKDLENLTGIKAHTIRIWEKRYGILKPGRTETQIRTYDDTELNILLNVSLLNKHGLKISKIAHLSYPEIQVLVRKQLDADAEAGFHENLLLALLNLDENLFGQTFDKLQQETGLEKLFAEHLLPFLERIGVMWQVNSITPAQEHFMSNLVRQKLLVEINKLESSASRSSVILYLPEHEMHEIGLLFYHYFLKKAGLKTYYLGQMLPLDALLYSIQKIKPRALVTSWVTHTGAENPAAYFKELGENTGIPVFGGGNLLKTNYQSLQKHLHLIDSLKDLELLVARCQSMQ